MCGRLCCPECFQTIPVVLSAQRQLDGLESVLTLYEYTDQMRHLLTCVKFDGNKLLAKEISVYISSVLELASYKNAVFIPVPISKARVRKRGFNQVDVLFSTVVQYFSVDYGVYIKRIRNTPPLFGLSRTERESLLRGVFSFQANEDVVQGRHVVLLDDILTSGATLRELAKLCRLYGASKVSAICIAEVYDDRDQV